MRGRISLTLAAAALALIVSGSALGAATHRKTRVEGPITGLSTTSITVDPANGPAVTCAIPAGRSLRGFAVGERVELRCRESGGRLVLRKLRHDRADRDDDDDDEVEVEGRLTALSTSSVTVTPRRGNAVTCSVPAGRSLAGFAIGDRVEIECDRRNGGLVLRKLKHEDDDEDDDDHGGHRGRH